MSEQIFIVTHKGWDDYVFTGNQEQCEGELYSLLSKNEDENLMQNIQIWKADEMEFEISLNIKKKKVGDESS